MSESTQGLRHLAPDVGLESVDFDTFQVGENRPTPYTVVTFHVLSQPENLSIVVSEDGESFVVESDTKAGINRADELIGNPSIDKYKRDVYILALVISIITCPELLLYVGGG